MHARSYEHWIRTRLDAHGNQEVESVSSNTATILQVTVGQPQTYFAENAGDRRAVEWTTAFYKEPVWGAVQVTEAGLEGDACADRQNHGGIEGAVLLYAAAHYRLWLAELPEPGWAFGDFGENLTVIGISEDNVCIGDRWRIGNALLEVSKPRQPCWKLCRRCQKPDLAKRVVQTGRSGWYSRVIETGELSAGDELTLESRPCPQWTVTRTNRLFYGLDQDPVAAAELASLPQLSLNWREELLNRRV